MYKIQTVSRCSPPYLYHSAEIFGWLVGGKNHMKQMDRWRTLPLILAGAAGASTWWDLPWGGGADPALVLQGYLQLLGSHPDFQIHRELPSHSSIQTFPSDWFPCWQWINKPVLQCGGDSKKIVVSSLCNTNLMTKHCMLNILTLLYRLPFALTTQRWSPMFLFSFYL